MKEQPIPVFYDAESAASRQYRETLRGLKAAATKAGRHILLISQKEMPDFSFDRAVDPAVIASDSLPYVRQVIHRLRQSGRRVVLAGLDSEQFGADISCATPSRRAETQQMINYLYSLGKRRFALVGFGLHSINDTFRYHAVMSALAALRLEMDERDVWRWHREPQSTLSAFISCADPYEVAICPNDTMAIRLINDCRLSGVHVPRDLWVASFGNTMIGRYNSPSITTMTMDMNHVGEQAFAVWQFLNAQPHSGAGIKITVPSRLLVRESTGGLLPDGETEIPAATAAPDPYYSEPTIAPLVSMENCLSLRDDLDMRIIALLMDNRGYESIAETLFISDSTLRYRLGKIYAEAECKGRAAFTGFVRAQLGAQNPFHAWLE